MPLHLAAGCPFVKKNEEKVGSILEKNPPSPLAFANERFLSMSPYCTVYQHLVLIYRENRVGDALNGGAVLIARPPRTNSTAVSLTMNGTAVERIFTPKSVKNPPFSFKNTILLPLAPCPLPLKSPLAASISRILFVIVFYFLSCFFKGGDWGIWNVV